MAYGTAISERYNGNAAPLTLTNAAALEQLRRERDELRRERDAEMAARQAAERQVRDVRRVLTAPRWQLSARVLYAEILIRANETHGEGPATMQGAARVWTHIAGERTVRANLAALEDAGLIERMLEREAVSTPDGKRWQTDSTIISPRHAPASLPALGPDANRERSRVTAKRERDELVLAREHLARVTCPECHTTGEWAITCTACGCILEDEPESGAPLERQTLPGNEYGRQTLPDGGEFNEGAAGGEAPATLEDANWPDAPPIIEPRAANFAGRETDGAAEALEHLTGPALAGADAVEYLASLGASFTFAPAQSKKAMGAAWPDNPHTAAEALAHLKRGGNVGILSGAGGLAVIDLDEHAGDFLRQHPHLAGAPLIFRRDAPERVKLIIRLEGEAGEYYSHKDSPGWRRKVEYLASRHHGIIAGTHASGATIEVRPGEMPTMTGEAARALCERWADAPPPIIDPPARISRAATSATASSTTGSATDDGIGREAVAWFNADAGCRREVDALLAKLPRSGKHYALRPDDGTPSATWGKCDGQRRIMRDYGRASKADALMDDFELWTRLEHNGDKAAAYREAARLYCAATGKRSPAWAEVKR